MGEMNKNKTVRAVKCMEIETLVVRVDSTQLLCGYIHGQLDICTLNEFQGENYLGGLGPRLCTFDWESPRNF